MPTDVYIYASHVDGALTLEASWHGEYVGHVESIGGAHPAGMRYRPLSTAQYAKDSAGKWAVFWEVAKLRELPVYERLPLADLTGFGKRRAYGTAFVPEGPLLIEHP
jgi:hypothetical protein